MEKQLKEGVLLKTKWMREQKGRTLLAIKITVENTKPFHQTYSLRINILDHDGFLLSSKGFHPFENNFIRKITHDDPDTFMVATKITRTLWGNVEVSDYEKDHMDEQQIHWELEESRV